VHFERRGIDDRIRISPHVSHLKPNIESWHFGLIPFGASLTVALAWCTGVLGHQRRLTHSAASS
jgi:hypothetical protein